MVFWGVAIALVALVVAAMARAAMGAAPAYGSRVQDVQVYRDQLQEVDRDLARGVLSADAATRTRLEVSRRLLEADAANDAPLKTGPRLVAIGIVAVIVAGVSTATYLQIGAPGYPDLPLAERISLIEQAREGRPRQVMAEEQVSLRPRPQVNSAEVEALVVQLRTLLQTRPEDLRGFRLLSRYEAGLGNMKRAYTAQERVILLAGADATPDDFATLAELQILAAGGYVSPEAEANLLTALEREPRNGTARYYLGLMYAQSGRPDLAWPIWRRLLGDSTPDAPWLEPIRLQIEEVSILAGDPTPLDQLPAPRPASPGPTADDIEAAAGMSLEERMTMIRGMVDGLSQRLATDGGPPEEWARLISALGVLGNTDAAFGIYTEAMQVFAGNQAALDVLSAAADRAGVNP
jgi:cytochrome c-type biogenesis protein CcmH